MQAYREIANYIICAIDDAVSVRNLRHLRSLELFRDAIKTASAMERHGYNPALCDDIIRPTLSGYWHVMKLPDRIGQRERYIEIAARDIIDSCRLLDGASSNDD